MIFCWFLITMDRNITMVLCFPGYTPSYYYLLSDIQRFILIAFTVVAIIPGVITNLLVLISLIKTKQLKTPSLQLMAILTMSDLLAAAVWEPISVITFSTKFGGQCILENLVTFWECFQLHFSAFVFCLIVVDRYVHLKYLMNYKKIMSWKRMGAFLLAILLLSIMQGILLALPHWELIDPRRIRMVFLVFLDIIVFIAAFIIVLRIRKLVEKQEDSMVSSGTTAYMNRLVKVMMVTLYAFFAPFIIVSIISVVFKSSGCCDSALQWLQFSLFLTIKYEFCNTTANSMIFITLNKPIKEFLKNSLCRCLANKDDSRRKYESKRTSTSNL